MVRACCRDIFGVSFVYMYAYIYIYIHIYTHIYRVALDPLCSVFLWSRPVRGALVAKCRFTVLFAALLLLRQPNSIVSLKALNPDQALNPTPNQSLTLNRQFLVEPSTPSPGHEQQREHHGRTVPGVLNSRERDIAKRELSRELRVVCGLLSNYGA